MIDELCWIQNLSQKNVTGRRPLVDVVGPTCRSCLERRRYDLLGTCDITTNAQHVHAVHISQPSRSQILCHWVTADAPILSKHLVEIVGYMLETQNISKYKTYLLQTLRAQVGVAAAMNTFRKG